MSRRPLVLVSALAIGDYFLWNWSLNGNHDVLALISGLTLPPLVVACVWLLALSVADMLAVFFRRPGTRAVRASASGRRRGRRRRPRPASAEAVEDAQLAAAKARADSRKLAA